MIYFVSKVAPNHGPNHQRERTDDPYKLDSKDTIKEYNPTKDGAIKLCEKKALENPGEQYAVFTILCIREAQKPAVPKLISKKINEAGEIVLDT